MIQVFGSSVGEEEIAEVTEVLKSNWLGIGPKVAAFEKELAKRNKLPSVVMTDSASNSLFTAIKMLNLPCNSEVILPSYTFVSCGHAVLLNNLTPVFCDVEMDTQNVSIKTIAPKVNRNTGAIMVVHYAGKPVDMGPILELGIPVIEDAAHAIDSSINGVYCGNFGDIGVYSFDSMKNLSIGEGGAITANSPTMIEKIRRLRYCGIAKSGLDASKEKDTWWETEVLYSSIRQMPSDVSAAIALAQLRKLDDLQAKRKKIWDTYQELLRGRGIDTPVDPRDNETHSYFTYAIQLLSNDRDKRNKLARHLYDNGIYTTLRYYPLHMMKLFREYNTGRLTNTELLNNISLNLPIHPNISETQLEYIIEKTTNFLYWN